MENNDDTAAAAAVTIGTAVGEYVMEERIGHGSESDVFLARDTLLGRRVAIKMLRSSIGDETHGMEEARFLARLEHPNIARVYHAKRHKGIWLVVYEYVEGGSLHRHVRTNGPLSPADSVALIAQAAAGLAYAHEAGIVHRDVKPHNLLLTRDQRVKLCDFGLAADLVSLNGSRGGGAGTPAFMAPELWCEGAASPRSDVYSLGATLFFLLTARVPFESTNMDELKSAHMTEAPELPAQIPIGVRETLFAMMAKDPQARPRSSERLARRLDALARYPDRRVVGVRPRKQRMRSPFVEAGYEYGLQRALSEGPDSACLDALLGALDAGLTGIWLQSTRPREARIMFEIAVNHFAHDRIVAARIRLDSRSALSEVLHGAEGSADSPELALFYDGLAASPAPFAKAPVVEIFASNGLDASLRNDVAQVARLGGARNIVTVLISPASLGEPAAALDGFRLIAMPSAESVPRYFEESVLRWVAAATAGRYRFSADALRVVGHYCTELGTPWPQLARDSLMIAAAAGSPFVTSWAVAGATQLATPPQQVTDVPIAWRTRPTRWPNEQLAELLAQIRAADGRSAAPEETVTPSILLLHGDRAPVVGSSPRDN